MICIIHKPGIMIHQNKDYGTEGTKILRKYSIACG